MTTQTIRLKRSAVEGRIPQLADLSLGEIAINTVDGRAFLRQTSGSLDQVFSFFIIGTQNSGSVFLTGSLNINGSTRLGGSLDDTHQFTGSLNIEGNIIITGSNEGISIGTSSVQNNRQIDIHSDSEANVRITTYNAAAMAGVRMRKANGSQVSPTVVANGEIIGSIDYNAFDGNSFTAPSQFRVSVDGEPSASSIPTKFTFTTTPISGTAFIERMVIKGSGNVGIGTTDPQEKLDVSGSTKFGGAGGPHTHQFTGSVLVTGSFIGIGTANPVKSLEILSNEEAGIRLETYGTENSTLRLRKARGTIDVPISVINGDLLGGIEVKGYNGTLFKDVSQIRVFVDGIPTGSSVPSKIIFTTSPVGTASFIERMVIKGSGNIGIGTTDPQKKLDVSGSTKFGDLSTENHQFTGSVSMKNDLTVQGIITAQEFHTEFVSASIIFTSGSTKFGDTLDDIHQFTGSLLVTGSNIILGDTNSTGNVIKVIGTGSDTVTLDGLIIERQWPRIRLTDTSPGGSDMVVWNIGATLRLGNVGNAGSVNTVPFYIDNTTSNVVIPVGNLYVGQISQTELINIDDGNGVGGTANIKFQERVQVGYQSGDLAFDSLTKGMRFINNGGVAMQITGTLVGIGTGVPQAPLHVIGQISASSLDVAGTGSFGFIAKGGGSFKIDHPDPSKPDKELWHSFVESPTSGDNLYRYRIEVSLDNEEVIMDLPDYWEFLNENPQVWVSPYKMLAQCTGWVSDDLKKLHILCEKAGKYEVLLIGTRKDATANKYWSGVERKK